MKNSPRKPSMFFLIAIVFLVIIVSVNREIFYFFSDIFPIVIGLMMFILAVNSRVYTERTVFLLITTLYLYVSMFDISKMMAYNGIGLDASINKSLQWYMAGKLVETISLTVIIAFLKRSNKAIYLSMHLILFSLFVCTMVLIGLDVFPQAYSTTSLPFDLLVSLITTALFILCSYLIYKDDLFEGEQKRYFVLVLLLKAFSMATYSIFNTWGDFFIILSDFIRFLSYAGLYLVFIQHIVHNPYKNLHQFFHDKEQELIRLSQRDSMTGLLNHSTTYQRLSEMINSQKEHLCVILLDVDNFKQINDSYGHIKGDEVLVKLTNGLEMLDYSEKIVGRYGGDEFIIAIPNITSNDIPNIFNQIKHTMDLVYNETEVAVTFSAGVVMWNKGDTATDLVHKADIKMYQSKEAGKNMYSVWEQGHIIE